MQTFDPDLGRAKTNTCQHLRSIASECTCSTHRDELIGVRTVWEVCHWNGILLHNRFVEFSTDRHNRIWY